MKLQRGWTRYNKRRVTPSTTRGPIRMNYRFQTKCAALVTCAMFAVACESGMRSPVSPSAVLGGVSALNADGSNLKVSAPLALTPLFEQTDSALKPQLVAKGGVGLYVPGATLSHRFQV